MSWIKRVLRITALGGAAMLVPFAGTAWAQPSNDSFSGATVIPSVPFSTTEDTTQATFGPEDTAAEHACGPANGQYSKSVWFAYTAASDEQLQLDTYTSSYQVAGAVVTGTPAAFSSVRCFLGATMLPVSQGTTYYIVLVQFGHGSGGTLNLSLTRSVPPPPAAPSVSIRTPANGAHYNLAQRVVADYSCQEGAGGPGIASCTGTVPNSSAIDSSRPGRGTFTVTAISQDGQRASRTVSYTILPSNRFTVSHIHTLADGTFTFSVRVPGPGSVDVLETAWNDNLASAAVLLKPAPDRFVFARKQTPTMGPRTVTVTVTPNQQGTRLVAHPRYRGVLRLWVSYTPDGGSYRTIGFYGLHLPDTCTKHDTVTGLRWRTVVRCN